MRFDSTTKSYIVTHKESNASRVLPGPDSNGTDDWALARNTVAPLQHLLPHHAGVTVLFLEFSSPLLSALISVIFCVYEYFQSLYVDRTCPGVIS